MEENLHTHKVSQENTMKKTFIVFKSGNIHSKFFSYNVNNFKIV